MGRRGRSCDGLGVVRALQDCAQRQAKPGTALLRRPLHAFLQTLLGWGQAQRLTPRQSEGRKKVEP